MRRQHYEDHRERQAVSVRQKWARNVASGGVAMYSLEPSSSANRLLYPSLKDSMKMNIRDKYNYIT